MVALLLRRLGPYLVGLKFSEVAVFCNNQESGSDLFLNCTGIYFTVKLDDDRKGS